MRNFDDKDILKDNFKLKDMPYDVPDGYFDSLKAGLKMIPRQSARKTFRWRTVLSVAAAAALLVAAGGILWESFYSQDRITEDDIIEYLIYTGVEIEEIEQL